MAVSIVTNIYNLCKLKVNISVEHQRGVVVVVVFVGGGFELHL